MSADNFSGSDLLFSAPMDDQGLRIKVIGVGMAGSNTVDHLRLHFDGYAKLAVVDTDSKTLGASMLQEKLLIGRSITRGLSTGGEAAIGRKVAESETEVLRKMCEGVDMVCIVTGASGGLGGGLAPYLAEQAFSAGALVMCFAYLPFSHEGARRLKQSEEALAQLREACHAVIPLPNDLLLQEIDETASVLDAFSIANEWVARGIQAITSMISSQGLINIDFASLRKAFEKRGGKTLFGLGYAEGDNFVEDALRSLDQCPLLHLPDSKFVRKTDSLLVSLQGGADLSMTAVQKIMEHLTDKYSSKDNTLLGVVVDGELGKSLRITVVGTTETGGAKVFKPTAFSKVPAAHGGSSSPIKPVAKPSKSSSKSKPEDQEEFFFTDEQEHRGVFQLTEANLNNDGQDLDVPTYLRRGIKIQLN